MLDSFVDALITLADVIAVNADKISANTMAVDIKVVVCFTDYTVVLYFSKHIKISTVNGIRTLRVKLLTRK